MTNVHCSDIQESLTEIADGRHIEPDLRAAIDAHLKDCSSCRLALTMEREKKNAVANTRHVEVPPLTVSHVRDLIAAEARREESAPSGFNIERVWNFVRTQPVWSAGIAAVFLATLLFWPSKDHEARFNESSLSFVHEAFSSYDTLAGSSTMQIRTADEQQMRQFFAEHGVNCTVLLPHFANVSLCGGSVSVKNGSTIAHVLYETTGHRICFCETNFDEASPGAKATLTDSARTCILGGNKYWYRNADGRTVCLWKIENTLCAAASDFSQSELASLFTNNQ